MLQSSDGDSERTTDRMRVLAVDDSRDATTVLSIFLRSHGYEVKSAYDGPAALQAALDFLPGVVVLDIGLPEMNGYEVAQRMRQEPALQNAVLVAITGYGQELDRQRSQEAGFDHHLVKPPDLEALLQLLAATRRQGHNGQ
jgi:CheY-like chemotaxis protein